MHYYVYHLRAGKYFYERTCGDKIGADHRVKELRKRGLHAFWLLDKTLSEAFY